MVLAHNAVYKHSIAMPVVKITVERLAPDSGNIGKSPMRGAANVIQSVHPAERRAGEGRGREGRRLCGVEGKEPRDQAARRERGRELQGGYAGLLPATGRAVPEGQVNIRTR
ncbi:hypothetical protein D3C84_490150 [compost metagenome]